MTTPLAPSDPTEVGEVRARLPEAAAVTAPKLIFVGDVTVNAPVANPVALRLPVRVGALTKREPVPLALLPPKTTVAGAVIESNPIALTLPAIAPIG